MGIFTEKVEIDGLSGGHGTSEVLVRVLLQELCLTEGSLQAIRNSEIGLLHRKIMAIQEQNEVKWHRE